MENKENVDPIPKSDKPAKSSRSSIVKKRRKFHGKAESHASPPKSFLDRLPVEIVDMICGEVWQDDIPAFRLQCKYICKIATPHMLHSVHVRFKKTSIDALLEISKHPVLSQNVKQINYEPNLVEKRSREDWEKKIPLVDSSSDVGFPRPPKQSASEREWRLFHRSVRKYIYQSERKPYTTKELDFAWPNYERYLREQDEMIEKDYASQDLYQAITALPNLTSIHVNSGFGLWHGYGWTDATNVNPYGDGLCHATSKGSDELGAPGLGQMVSLINMVHRAGVKLTSLRIGSLSWRFFYECEDDDGEDGELFNTMNGVMHSLQDFELFITTWSEMDDSEDIDEGEVEECTDFMKGGMLARMLSGAPDLHKLAISFDAYESGCPIELQDLVCDMYWPHLYIIRLDCIDTYEQDWLNFFKRHAKTIKRVALGTIRLMDGNWPDVLENMQNMLELDEVQFRKELIGLEPHLQMWRFDPPGCTSSKDDSVQENRTRWALEKYMIRGGICPLRDPDAHPQTLFDLDFFV
ncbi:MAG: hypothetical protein Q9209_001250 [Squamulea sp. 1 TL-2023]